ncbi:hypothetical protein D3C85_1166880 [compost metagenome]
MVQWVALSACSRHPSHRPHACDSRPPLGVASAEAEHQGCAAAAQQAETQCEDEPGIKSGRADDRGFASVSRGVMKNHELSWTLRVVLLHRLDRIRPGEPGLASEVIRARMGACLHLAGAVVPRRPWSRLPPRPCYASRRGESRAALPGRVAVTAVSNSADVAGQACAA